MKLFFLKVDNYISKLKSGAEQMKTSKKIFVAGIFFLFCGFKVFSSEMDIGIYGKAAFPLGGVYSEFVAMNIGGGASFDWEMPWVKNLGLGANLEFGGNITRAEGSGHKNVTGLGSMLMLSALVNVWYNFNIGDSFQLRPQIGFGMGLHLPNLAANWHWQDSSTGGRAFADLILQFALSARFFPGVQKKFGIEVAPAFAMFMQNPSPIMFAAVRAGVVFKLAE